MQTLLLFIIIVFALAIIVVITLLLVSKRKVTEIQKQYDKALKLWDQHKSSLDETITRLSKYQNIADADEQAQKVKSETEVLIKETTAKSNSIVQAANEEAAKITAAAKQQAKVLTDEAKTKLDTALTQASESIAQAHKKAEEIGGKAYEALKNADLYEKTAAAMKNLVEGYGDQYLIPERSLLDELAEDFGYTQAGDELKKAREKTKSMVRSRTAAICDYVEQNRKDTAINFVVDAFNGKVDSILSRVKHDNAGTLEQEIRDAYTLVNYNGKAFRNARISDEFLLSRLAELKWAETAQQLKLEEREEQKRIREQMREEEKARREYERAIKDAQKEEEYLKKAMEKAQEQINQATSEQKEKYEKQLQELSGKLKEAEERNQRALSMAQQTRRGYVYIISNVGSFGEDVYKIGLTRRLEPMDRVNELGDSSVPFQFDVHALILSDDAPSLETKLHKHFLLMQMNKVNYRKEFFKVDIKHIREEIDTMGLQVKWTMAADAKEYRETLAIEKQIKDNPAMKEKWIKKQLELNIYDNADVDIEENATLLTNSQ